MVGGLVWGDCLRPLSVMNTWSQMALHSITSKLIPFFLFLNRRIGSYDSYHTQKKKGKKGRKKNGRKRKKKKKRMEEKKRKKKKKKKKKEEKERKK